MFDALGERRPKLLWGWQESWQGRGLRSKLDSQSKLELPAVAPPLPEVSEEERTRLKYRISDHSAGHHLVEFYRERRRVLGEPNFVHLHACHTEVWAQRRVTNLSGQPRKDVLPVHWRSAQRRPCQPRSPQASS